MKKILQAATLITAMIASSAQATLYNVNRSFTDGVSSATLTGTLGIPIGNYTIQNSSASPFTSVNLTLTVNGTPFLLQNALTDYIFGSGQFFIGATATTLTFSTANADGSNPADLIFSDNTNPGITNRYSIGYNGSPGFEVAYTHAGDVGATATFPTIFAVVPEPSTACLTGACLLLHLGFRRLRNRRNEKNL